MFKNGKFQELKGSEMDSYLKREFLQFFADKPHFELYYIVVDNSKLTDEHCEDVAGIFNYALKIFQSAYFSADLFSRLDICHINTP